MSQESGNFSSKLPSSYQNEGAFAAPAHSLNSQQREQVVEAVESSAGHIPGGQQGQQGSGLTSGLGSTGSGSGSGIGSGLGSGTGHSGLSGTGSSGLSSGGITSGSGHDLRDSLAGTRTQERSGPSGGEYNLRQGDLQGSNIGVGRDAAHLEDARNKLAGVAGTSGLGGAAGSHGSGGFGQGEFGNTGHSGVLTGQGDGQRQAAGLGAGGLAPAAAAQGLSGPTGNTGREAVGASHGGVLDSSAPGSGSGDGSGLGKGAALGGAAGLAGAGAYGASSGRTGHGSNMNEAIADASRGGSGSGGLASAAGREGESGKDSLLAKPTHSDNKLVGELEERAMKAGTHAAGFGTHGKE